MSGDKVKYTLEHQQTQNPHLVRVDWLRFTLPVESCFPQDKADLSWVPAYVERDQECAVAYNGLMPAQLAVEILRADGSFCYLTPKSLAWQGLVELHSVLPDVVPLSVSAEESGMDFYAARCPIMIDGAVAGYVLAGGRSPQQANTVHFNLFGAACMHLTPERLAALADMIEGKGGWITRCDLALDVWEGLDVTTVQAAWADGLFDVRGKRPSQREMGAWSSGHSRTFEVGSRATGKLLRAYEKGDQLFGPEANDPWVRLEVEFRASHRILDIDLLRRPAEFFVGAYPWLAEYVRAFELELCPAVIPTISEVMDKTADAAVERLVKWAVNTAGPSFKAIWDMGGDLVAELISEQQHREPKRLRGFSRDQLLRSFDRFAGETVGPALIKKVISRRLVISKLAAFMPQMSAPSFVGAF
jgi:phage replication initiation protein